MQEVKLRDYEAKLGKNHQDLNQYVHYKSLKLKKNDSKEYLKGQGA